MKMVIVSILDTAAGAYGRPAFVASEGVAIRQFQDEVNRKSDDNQLYKHPDDFQMYYLGTYDDNSGGMDLLASPKLISRAKDVMIRDGVDQLGDY
jgi:hypothetical protein